MAKKKMKIDWQPARTRIPYGTPLDETHLNAVALHQGNPVPGKAKYSHGHGALLPVGQHTLTVTYEPEDNVSYEVGEEMAVVEICHLIVTAKITASDKAYDGMTTAMITDRRLTDVLEKDEVSVTVGEATFDTKDVGQGKTVTARGLSLSGAGADNYQLSSPTSTTKADITKKPVSPQISASNKVYDGKATATITARPLTDVLEKDEVSLKFGEATFDTKDVGQGKTVTARGLSLIGAGADNYHLASPTATTKADITPTTPKVLVSGERIMVVGVDDKTPVLGQISLNLTEGSPVKANVRFYSSESNYTNTTGESPVTISAPVLRELTGMIKTKTRGGVPDYQVQLLDLNTNEIVDETKTDSEGRYHFLCGEGSYKVLVGGKQVAVPNPGTGPSKQAGA